MKRFLTFVVCGLVMAAVSCTTGSEQEEAYAWFGSSGAEVSGTDVVLSCGTEFAAGALEAAEAGFVYRDVQTGEERRAVATVSGTSISCSLTGLFPQTQYWAYPFADFGGDVKRGRPFLFTTGAWSSTDPDPDPAEPAFGPLSASGITANAATLSASFSYEGDERVEAVWFAYNAAGGAEQRADAASPAPGTVTVALSGLRAETAYTYRLAVTVGGKSYRSAAATFTTAKEGELPPPSGDTKHSGWAELPSLAKDNSDFYYVEHFCAMGTSSSAPKGRNFSGCFSASKRCPVWIAAPLHDCYASNVSRKNNYKDDPSLPSSIQVGKWSGYTRGHMLGSAERLVSREANDQVMYFSNIAPQLGSDGYFNTGGGQWNTAEDWVDKQWRSLADTLYQVVGTYWSNTSTTVSGTAIPTDYYIVLLKVKSAAGKKWAVDCSRDELQCIGVWIQHKRYAKGDVVKPQQFKERGIFMSVADIERKTGHRFFTNVPNAPKDSFDTSDWRF